MGSIIGTISTVVYETGADRFMELLTVWVLCLGLRTGTRLWRLLSLRLFGQDQSRFRWPFSEGAPLENPC